MGIKQLYNDNLRKLPNEYGDVSVMNRSPFPTGKCYEGEGLYCLLIFFLFIYGHGYVSFMHICI